MGTAEHSYADDGAATRTFRLGFVLARREVTLPWLPDRRYRGLDRHPFVPFLGELDADIAALWTRYLDAENDGIISRQLQAARRFKEDLDSADTPVELLYAEAVVVPSRESLGLSGDSARDHERSLAWLQARSAPVLPVPSGFHELGHDVCTPIPDFHSAIFEPGLIPQDSELARCLNGAGLIEQSTKATGLMHAANTARWSLSGLISVIRVFAEEEG